MKRVTQSLLTLFIALTISAAQPARAQQPQIPTLQVCNVPGVVVGQGAVNIISRGTFSFSIQVQCDPATGYPVLGGLSVNIAMSDTTLGGGFNATSADQITVTGKITPTAYLSGRCTASGIVGCR